MTTVCWAARGRSRWMPRLARLVAALGLLTTVSGCIVVPAYPPPPPRYHYYYYGY